MKKLFLLLALVLVPVFVCAALGTEETKVVKAIISVQDFLINAGIAICGVGLAFGGAKMGAGDEFGRKMFMTSLIAIGLLLTTKVLVNILIEKSKIANSSNSEIQNVFKN